MNQDLDYNHESEWLILFRDTIGGDSVERRESIDAKTTCSSTF